jgi:hypothetical protein
MSALVHDPTATGLKVFVIGIILKYITLQGQNEIFTLNSTAPKRKIW